MPVTVTEITHDEGTTIGVDRSQRVRRFQVRGFSTGAPENAITSMVAIRPDLALNEPHPAPWAFMQVYDHGVSEVVRVEDESGASKLPTEAIVDVRYIDSTSTFGGALTSLNAVTFSQRVIENTARFYGRTVTINGNPVLIYDQDTVQRQFVRYTRRERNVYADEGVAQSQLEALIPLIGFAYARPASVNPNPDNAVWVYIGSSVVRGSGNEVFLTSDFMTETPRAGRAFDSNEIYWPGGAPGTIPPQSYDPTPPGLGSQGYIDIPYTPPLAELTWHWDTTGTPVYDTLPAGHPFGGAWILDS